MERDNTIILKHMADLPVSGRVRPSRETAARTNAAINEALADPTWNTEIQEARNNLRGLRVRRAGTRWQRLAARLFATDAVLYCTGLAAFGGAVISVTLVTGWPVLLVALGIAGAMILALHAIQKAHGAA
jgi:hypothetical protein